MFLADEIQFETLRRLHFGRGLSLDDIDATNVLPKLRLSNSSGLIYKMTQRCVCSANFVAIPLVKANMSLETNYFGRV
jgi:hypothetical protein